MGPHVIGPRLFEGTCCLHLPGFGAPRYMPLKMRALCTFGKPEIGYPVTWGHIPEKRWPHQHCRDKIKESQKKIYVSSLFFLLKVPTAKTMLFSQRKESCTIKTQIVCHPIIKFTAIFGARISFSCTKHVEMGSFAKLMQSTFL
jgi:hypothetical protein